VKMIKYYLLPYPSLLVFFCSSALKCYHRKIIDSLMQLKMNALHWHLTDNEGFTLGSTTHPEINNPPPPTPAPIPSVDALSPSAPSSDVPSKKKRDIESGIDGDVDNKEISGDVTGYQDTYDNNNNEFEQNPDTNVNNDEHTNDEFQPNNININENDEIPPEINKEPIDNSEINYDNFKNYNDNLTPDTNPSFNENPNDNNNNNYNNDNNYNNYNNDNNNNNYNNDNNNDNNNDPNYNNFNNYHNNKKGYNDNNNNQYNKQYDNNQYNNNNRFNNYKQNNQYYKDRYNNQYSDNNRYNDEQYVPQLYPSIQPDEVIHKLSLFPFHHFVSFSQ
jgi:hypothetical protein